jgi:hypothetical protein
VSNSNTLRFRHTKEDLISRATGTEITPIQRISSGEIKQLKSRIHSTTHGDLAAISRFEKFKCDLVASLKLFFLWGSQAKKCDKTGHAPLNIDGELHCSRCGEILISFQVPSN